ncbi:hypothetical protein TrLO_g8434 [Triparma laevis f. longispina]|uniref:TLC domain-containing protein n=1 Tax=Triparma laevis f. longispina TaxID=1714387 RepID=A0A9W7AFP5_9STRA|nr:hypothetical protein TrLO_g8434 [Triparma laevis f. longispina]
MFSLHHYESTPAISSTITTSFVWCWCLVLFEHLLRQFFLLPSIQALSPILQNTKNTQIISRHIGTDFAAAVMCSYLGLTTINGGLGSIWKSLKSPTDKALYKKARAGYKKRMWSYSAEGFRVFVFFFAYQWKNLYDAYVWNDGPEFIFHHTVSIITSWAGMYPGLGQVYAVFFMGLSEISTATLVLLANFDPTLGVDGLAEAFPLTKIICAVAFVVTFVTCRNVMWPYAGWHYWLDSLEALNNPKDKQAKEHAFILKRTLFVLVSLTFLQFLWLGQIFVMGYEEIQKM